MELATTTMDPELEEELPNQCLGNDPTTGKRCAQMLPLKTHLCSRCRQRTGLSSQRAGASSGRGNRVFRNGTQSPKSER